MRKRLLRIVVIVAVVLLVGGAVAWRSLRLGDLSRIGAGYAAQQTCACLFISGRTPESCHSDLDAMAQRLVSVKIGAGQVTARSLLFHATARYEKGYGCSLAE